MPRAWVVHQVEVLRPLGSHDPEELRRRTEEVFCRAGVSRDLRESAVVETDDPCAEEITAAVGQAPPALSESCRVVRYDPTRVEIRAHLERPGLVVLADQFYPGWQLEVHTKGDGGAPRRPVVLRANRVMRGAWLAAGDHHLVYRYRPASFLWGALFSAAGWIGLTLAAACWAVRRKAS